MLATLPDALADALARVISDVRREARADLETVRALHRAEMAEFKAQSAETTAELRTQITELTSELQQYAKASFAEIAQAVEKVKDGEPGPAGEQGMPGKDGKDVDPEVVAEIVLARMPTPEKGEPGRDGQDADPAVIGGLIEEAFNVRKDFFLRSINDAIGDALAESVDPGQIEALINEKLALAVAALPRPEKGEKGDPGERGEQGEKGESGEPGEKGESGEPGEKGDPGEPGEKGDPGERGEKGDSGEVGPQGERGLDGQDGAPGTDGKDADPEIIALMVSDELARRMADLIIPKGEKGDPGERGEKGEPGPAGESVDLAWVEELVVKTVSAQPRPRDGEPGPPGPPGRDGIDGSIGPRGEKGDPGKDGVGIAGMLLDRQGCCIATMSDGSIHNLGVTVGRDGVDGKDGAPGRDGLSIEDLSAEFDGERTVTWRFARGDVVREYPVQFPIPLDRGVYKETNNYIKGDGVTYAGSFWIAQKDAPEGKPDKSDGSWRLAVKHGRDGRDGKPGEKGERGPEGRPGRDLTVGKI